MKNKIYKLVIINILLGCVYNSMHPMQQAVARIGSRVTAENFKKVMTNLSTAGYFGLYFGFDWLVNRQSTKEIALLPTVDVETDAFVRETLRAGNYPNEMIDKLTITKEEEFAASKGLIIVPLDKYAIKSSYEKYFSKPDYFFINSLNRDGEITENPQELIQKRLNVSATKAQMLWKDMQAYRQLEYISGKPEIFTTIDFFGLKARIHVPNPHNDLQCIRGALLHEGGHIYNKDFHKGIATGLCMPFFVYGISKKTGAAINASLMNRLMMYPRSKAIVLIAQGLSKPLLIVPKIFIIALSMGLARRFMEYRADSESIKRASDPEILRSKQNHFEERAVKENYSLLQRVFATHPTSKSRARRCEKAAQKLENELAQQQQQKE